MSWDLQAENGLRFNLSVTDHARLKHLLIELGQDLTNFSDSNDGEAIPEERYKGWGKAIQYAVGAGILCKKQIPARDLMSGFRWGYGIYKHGMDISDSPGELGEVEELEDDDIRWLWRVAKFFQKAEGNIHQW